MQGQTLKEFAERLERRRQEYAERVREVEEESFREFRKSLRSTYERFLKHLQRDLSELRGRVLSELGEELREEVEKRVARSLLVWLIVFWLGTILVSSIFTMLIMALATKIRG